MSSKPSDTKQKALDILHNGVQQIMSSSGWRKALEFHAHFRTYSFFNTNLILVQQPEAQLVAGYRKWQELDRQVRKGEKGITILAPLIKKDPDNPTERILYGFRNVAVFDVSQTDGEPLPMPEAPKLLTDDSDAIQAVLRALQGFCEGQGIPVGRDLDMGAALGIYNRVKHSINLRPDLPPLQELKTLTHEVAHALMHREASDRALGELEAESCAFLVLHELCLDTSSYSFLYLAHWADSLEDLIAAGERASKASRQVIDALTPLLSCDAQGAVLQPPAVVPVVHAQHVS